MNAMTITNVFASLAVADLDRARTWYEELLGKASQPMPEVLEWKLSKAAADYRSTPDRSARDAVPARSS
jgi:hypothetical protein